MLRADFVAVELSDSCQNLAHRLEAMRYFKQHSRRQWFFITCAIALLGTVAIVPWRLVAAEGKVEEKAEQQQARQPTEKATSLDKIPEDQPFAVVVQLRHANPEEVVTALKQQYQDLLGPAGWGADQGKHEPKFKGKLQIEAFAANNSVVVSAPKALSDDVLVAARKLDEEAGKDAEQERTGAAEVAAPKAWGDLKGRFIYDGKAPAPAPIQGIQEIQDKAVFGKMNLVDQSLVVDKDGSLANVVVWVRQNNVPIHSSYGALKEVEATIQSSRGQFLPRIVPCWVGQPLEMRNLEEVPVSCGAGDWFNLLVPPKNTLKRRPLENPEPLPVKISDNLHPWKVGWMVAKPHPYVAVSDRDGTFTIKNLPAGVPLEFQVWQERAGQVQKARINGKDAGWTKGRFTMQLAAGENNLGEIKLAAGQFNERELPQAVEVALPKAELKAEPKAPNRGGESRVGWSDGSGINARDRAKQEKLLVGTWRGGSSDGLITFHEGGTYEEFNHPLIPPNTSAPDGMDRVQGRWVIEPGSGKLALSTDATGASLRGLPMRPVATRRATPRYDIRRLDESLLRLSGLDWRGEHKILFFRRADEQPKQSKYDAALPEGIRRLAEIMALSADEAQALADAKFDWMKAWKLTEPQVKLLERVAAARRGTIDLAELFELTKDEAAAYAEIYGMTDGDFPAIEALNRDSQLSAAEQAAIIKLVAARKELSEIEIAVVPGANQAQSSAKNEKLKTAFARTQKNLVNLLLFLEATAFAKPKSQEAYPVTPYPDTSKKPLPGAGRFGVE
jgi:hypothetical protein